MKTLAATDLQITNRQYKLDAVIRQIETIFQEMQFPDVEGIPISQFLSDNLEHVGDGVFRVVANTLVGEIAIESTSGETLYLRNQAGTLQWSSDRLLWHEMSGAISTLTDGTHSVTAQQLAAHVDDAGIHYAQAAIDHAAILHRGVNDHAALDAHLANTAIHAAVTLPLGYDSTIMAYKDAGTITLQAGGQALSLDGTTVYTVAADTDIALASHLANGLSEAANTKYRLWVGQNPAGNTEYVFSTSEGASTPNQIGTAAPLVHPCLLRWCVRNDSNSNFLRFIIEGGFYRYLSSIALAGSDATQLYSGTSPTSGSPGSIDLSAFVPSSKPGYLLFSSSNLSAASAATITIVVANNAQTFSNVGDMLYTTAYVPLLSGVLIVPYAFTWYASGAFPNTRIILVGFWG